MLQCANRKYLLVNPIIQQPPWAIQTTRTKRQKSSVLSEPGNVSFPFQLNVTTVRTSTRILAEKGRVGFCHLPYLPLQEDSMRERLITRGSAVDLTDAKIVLETKTYNTPVIMHQPDRWSDKRPLTLVENEIGNAPWNFLWCMQFTLTCYAA